MEIRWSSGAQRDVERLYRFLVAVNPRAARELVRTLRNAPARLLENPRIGVRVEGIAGREVRRIFKGHYELQYEITLSEIVVFRVWHAREDR